MAEIKYKIPMVSVRSLLAYAKEKEDGSFSFSLRQKETACISQSTLQDENAMFYQAMRLITDNQFTQPKKDVVIDDLYDVVIYLDFEGIFDRSADDPKVAVRQKKAESLFRNEGVTLDFGSGPKQYIAFERSGSMSRNSRLSFVRIDLFNLLLQAITINLPLQECELSKLYAYNGLMFSSGKRIETNIFNSEDYIVIVDNPSVLVKDMPVVTVQDITGEGNVRKYERVEKTDDITVTAFDGEGLVSPEFAEEINTKLYGEKNKHHHTSFQIRLPYVKGMIHQVDFKEFFAQFGITQIVDIWGKAHDVKKIKLLLTKSQFKCASWLGENWNFKRDYCMVCRLFGHALYVTNVSKEQPEGETTLNYQFLCTLSIHPDQFRPDDLPLGWDRPPQDDERHWLTKATEQKYYSLCSDEQFRLDYFIKKSQKRFFGRKTKDDILADILRTNPLFINESLFSKQLDDMAEKILKDYAVGRLVVEGENRFLSGDLYELFSLLSPCYLFESESSELRFKLDILYYDKIKLINIPNAVSKDSKKYTLLRSPHIARNEEVVADITARTYNEYWYYKYFSHLTDIVTISSSSLFAERLGGADYDGDMIKIISDPIVCECVANHYKMNYKPEIFGDRDIFPLLQIPSAKPVKADPTDWYSRFQTVKNTFSARIGQISNAALSRSILAYDENTDKELREKYLKDIEMLEILTGLEIDSVKSGIKPDLSEYLEDNKVGRSKFLKYKDIMEKSDSRRQWYEPTFEERFKKYFSNIDWDSVSSNVEKLPYYAMMLKKHTKTVKRKPAAASELFTFATEKDWEKKLNPDRLAEVKDIIEIYEKCLNRIRSYNNVKVKKTKYKDVARILFMRDMEDEIDADELYALFTNLSVDRISEILEAAQIQQWQFMKPDERIKFLTYHLPEEQFRDYYDLFADFSFGGYKILTDILMDIEGGSKKSDLRKLHFDKDTAEMTELINAYEQRQNGISYRDAVAEKCLELVKKKAKPEFAVKCAVALGKRNFMWDVLWKYAGKFVLKRGVSNDK